MSIRIKNLIGFAVIAVFGASLGQIGLTSVRTLLDMTNELYKIEKTSAGVSGVLNRHYVWRQGLTEAVLADSEFKGSLDPNACALGQWLKSEAAKNISDPEVLSLLQRIQDPHAYIHNEAKNTLEHIQAGKGDEAIKHLKEAVLPKTQEVIALLNRMEERFAALADEKTSEMVKAGEFFSHRIVLLSIAALVLCVVFALLFTRWIAQKFYWYENILDCIPFPISVTDNDRRWTFVNKPVENFLGKKRSDIMGQPCSNWGAAICNTENCGINCLERGKTLTFFEQMGMDFKVNLNNLTDKRGKKVGHIETVEEITEFLKRQKAEAELARSINKSIMELSGSISDVAKKTKDNAERAGRSATLAGMIKQNAERGSAQMDEMMAAVKEINQSSQSINNVIKVINDIAFQTNLLALNASVEAARVGEHGKGFAVVADEVRNLATRSAEAAMNSDAMIQDSMAKAELGVRIASDTAASLAEIMSGINDSHQIANEIAKSSEEQSLSIQFVNNSIDQVSQLVEKNRSIAEAAPEGA